MPFAPPPKGNWCEAGELSGEGGPSLGGVACHAYYRRLGFYAYFDAVGSGRKSSSLSDTVFVMLANRLLDPGSNRRTITEWLSAVALPKDVGVPSLDRCYRAVDALADAKESSDAHLYSELCNLTNLDLSLVCYDLTSSYFETRGGGRPEFASLAYGYSRDHRGDRP